MSKAIVRKPEIVDNLSITTSGLSDREWTKAAIAEETEFRAASIRNAIETGGRSIAQMANDASRLLALMVKHDDPIPKWVNPRLMQSLQRIAAGRLLPEAYAQFRWSPRLIDHIGACSVAEQEKLIRDGRVSIVVVGNNGGFDTRLLPVDEMNAPQREQVFGPDGLRSETAQVAWLEAKRTSRALTTANRDMGDGSGVKIEPTRHRVVINGLAFTARQLMEMAAQIA